MKIFRKYLKFVLLTLGVICLNLSLRESFGMLLLFLAYLEYKGLLNAKSNR